MMHFTNPKCSTQRNRYTEVRPNWRREDAKALDLRVFFTVLTVAFAWIKDSCLKTGRNSEKCIIRGWRENLGPQRAALHAAGFDSFIFVMFNVVIFSSEVKPQGARRLLPALNLGIRKYQGSSRNLLHPEHA